MTMLDFKEEVDGNTRVIVLYHKGKVYGKIEEVDGEIIVTVYTNKRLMRGDAAFRLESERGIPLELIQEALSKYHLELIQEALSKYHDGEVELLGYTLAKKCAILKSQGVDLSFESGWKQ